MRQIAEPIQAGAAAAGLEVRLNLDPQVPLTQADPDQLEQMLLNLCSNAMQALAEQPQPRRLTLHSQFTEHQIRIRVVDNGPGVPEVFIAHLFEPFFTTREVGKGIGLGLSIAHGIVMDHQGRLYYQPAPNGGACFIIELPVVAAAPAATEEPVPVTPTPEEIPASAPPARILILDDEPTLAELTGVALRLLGHDVIVSLSPEEALEQIDSRTFDLVISDFRMPVMDGGDFYAAAVKRRPELARRVIFLTGDVVHEAAYAFLKESGLPYLLKPFQLVQLEQLIATTLATAESSVAESSPAPKSDLASANPSDKPVMETAIDSKPPAGNTTPPPSRPA